MPTYEFGDMWDAYQRCKRFFVTANSCLREDGRLVMGAGMARQARKRFSHLNVDLERHAGKKVRNHLSEYNLRLLSFKLGLFQTKTHPSKDSGLGIISDSASALKRYAEPIRNSVHLNFPGIGCGNLPVEEVKPALEPLPGNVHVWRYSKEQSAL
jgi:hypothetical protein